MRHLSYWSLLFQFVCDLPLMYYKAHPNFGFEMCYRYSAHYYHLRYTAAHKGFWCTDDKILYFYTSPCPVHFLLFFSISVYHKFTCWFTFALIARVETAISVMTLSSDNNTNYKIVGCHPGFDKCVDMTACYRVRTVNALVNWCLYENSYQQRL